MSDPRLDELARQLVALPPEAWDRPAPPPPPWPVDAVAEPKRRLAFPLRKMAVAVAAVALLAIGIAVGMLVRGPGDSTTQLALRPFDGRGAGASADVSLQPRAGGDMSVRLAGLRPSGADDFYELWLIGEDGKLVSLGSFRVPASGTAEMTLPLPADPSRFRYLDVSREPGDGDPGHSGISVLRGPAT